ncbi:hypothetical protein LCGC14_0552520 [marine sediment metagenome]|uniref:Uncharacterized protein n=1 Tax=marine sediment metagenome TaxID=412755 RepID=A0A0F9RUM0_9ZZZZ
MPGVNSPRCSDVRGAAMNGDTEHTLAAAMLGWIGWVSLASVRTFTNKTKLDDIKDRLVRIEKKLDGRPTKESEDGNNV